MIDLQIRLKYRGLMNESPEKDISPSTRIGCLKCSVVVNDIFVSVAINAFYATTSSARKFPHLGSFRNISQRKHPLAMNLARLHFNINEKRHGPRNLQNQLEEKEQLLWSGNSQDAAPSVYKCISPHQETQIGEQNEARPRDTSNSVAPLHEIRTWPGHATGRLRRPAGMICRYRADQPASV